VFAVFAVFESRHFARTKKVYLCNNASQTGRFKTPQTPQTPQIQTANG
jgi:hypothetical protein